MVPEGSIVWEELELFCRHGSEGGQAGHIDLVVITQFFGHIVRGEPIKLVDGGSQKRAFTYIDDGIDALVRIIANKDDIAMWINKAGDRSGIGRQHHKGRAAFAGLNPE